MAAITTALQHQGDVECQAAALYGKGDTLLRIGNGGAGATGLIAALAHDYLSTLPQPRSIAWVCNHSLNSQVALYRGYVDIALTYEREREALATREGWSIDAGCMFHDHFCLVGPTSDPANVAGTPTLAEALRRIASRGALFHSRADGSATMEKERSAWAKVGLEPWRDEASARWYTKSLLSPSEALKAAATNGAYLLSDRSTLLRQTMLQTVSDVTVFLEPARPDDWLMNSCHALYSPTSRPEILQETRAFLEYVGSERGQNVIASYGVDSCGLPLFAPLRDGFAQTKLAGGRPMAGQWTRRAHL